MIEKTKFGAEAEAESLLAPPTPADGARWGMDLIGLLSYIFIEYTRLPTMYPVLAPLQLGKVALIAAMIGYVIARTPNRAPGNALLKCGVIFLAFVTALSALSANYRVLPTADLWNIPEQLIAFFLVGRCVVSRWRQKAFVLLVLLLCFKVAQHGIRNYVALRGVTSDEAIVKWGIVGGGGGFFDNAADLGVAMCVVFGLSFALMQVKDARKTRWFCAICLVTFGAMIMLCGSRGAVVGAAGVVLTAWFRSPKKKWAAPMLLLFVLGTIYLIPNASKERFQSAKDWENDKTARHRVLLWGAGVRMWKDYPTLGVGPSNFQYVRAAEYPIDDPELNSLAYVCHSMYVQLLSELGTLGAIAFLVILFAYFRINSRVRKRVLSSGGTRQDWEYCLASGLDLAMVGYLVSGIFVSVFWYPHMWIFGGLATGLNSATTCLTEKPSAKVQNPDNRPPDGLAPTRTALAGFSAARRP